LFIATLFLLVPVSSANAGILAFLGNLFLGVASATDEAKTVNSQNMTLLQAAVNADPHAAQGGGDITIVSDSALLPSSGPEGTLADIDNSEGIKAKGDQISVYIVRADDTLSGIAKMFGVTVNTIKWANDIAANGVIHEGQTLVILPVSGVRHVVKKGDTIATIASQYKADARDIMEFNGIESGDALTVGQVVVVPDGQLAVSVAPKSSTSSSGLDEPTGVVRISSPSYDGYYAYPLPKGTGTVSQSLHGYNAVDLAAPKGTPVTAAADGEVIVAKYAEGDPWFGGYGNYIVIQHANGTQTLYAHLSGEIVSRGWSVVKGQVIGYVGQTGKATGPHLHIEVRGAKNPFAK
jgi:LysM repeat protein